MRLQILPIFLAFFLMGLADAMGPMSDGVKKQYELSNLVATLLPFFVFIAFAIFSLPGGLLAARIGKKKLLLLGLGLNAIALLLPSLYMPGFGLLLCCISEPHSCRLQAIPSCGMSALKAPTAGTSASLRA
jgi:FHS family L-fucose permease-like MFS transporter